MTNSTTSHASDLATTIDTYLSAWNERDTGRRAELIAAAWSEEGVLVDPPLMGEGHRGISDAAAAMHEHYPDHAFRRTSGVDAHHEFFRFAWELVGPGDVVAVSGLDVGVLDEDGRLLRVVGFFGGLPEHEQPR